MQAKFIVILFHPTNGKKIEQLSQQRIDSESAKIEELELVRSMAVKDTKHKNTICWMCAIGPSQAD